MNPPIIGRPLSPAEQQQLNDLQALFKPADALKRVDDFAKWIFTSIAVVGTLGAGLSNSAFATLTGLGKLLLAIAIMLVGASLFASTLALEPEWVHANPSSRDSMLAAVNENLRRRRKPIRIAAALFAFALITAASAPIASTFDFRGQHKIVLGYEMKPDGKFTGLLAGTGLSPYAVAELRLEGSKNSKLWLAPVTRKSADAKGTILLSVDLDNAREAGSEITLSGAWSDLSSPDLTKESLPNPEILKINLPPPPPGAEQPKTTSTNSETKQNTSTDKASSVNGPSNRVLTKKKERPTK